MSLSPGHGHRPNDSQNRRGQLQVFREGEAGRPKRGWLYADEHACAKAFFPTELVLRCACAIYIDVEDRFFVQGGGGVGPASAAPSNCKSFPYAAAISAT
eukprot:3254799-Pyramimonas_sp.AAC.1